MRVWSTCTGWSIGDVVPSHSEGFHLVAFILQRRIAAAFLDGTVSVLAWRKQVACVPE